jgi:hypothetical protein
MNFSIEVLALLVPTQEIPYPVSNPKTGYPCKTFCGFLSFSRIL